MKTLFPRSIQRPSSYRRHHPHPLSPFAISSRPSSLGIIVYTAPSGTRKQRRKIPRTIVLPTLLHIDIIPPKLSHPQDLIQRLSAQWQMGTIRTRPRHNHPLKGRPTFPDRLWLVLARQDGRIKCPSTQPSMAPHRLCHPPLPTTTKCSRSDLDKAQGPDPEQHARHQ